MQKLNIHIESTYRCEKILKVQRKNSIQNVCFCAFMSVVCGCVCGGGCVYVISLRETEKK